MIIRVIYIQINCTLVFFPMFNRIFLCKISGSSVLYNNIHCNLQQKKLTRLCECTNMYWYVPFVFAFTKNQVSRDEAYLLRKQCRLPFSLTHGVTYMPTQASVKSTLVSTRSVRFLVGTG